MMQKVKSVIKELIPQKHLPYILDLYRIIRYCLLFPLYVGNKCECPFCKHHLLKFLPEGLNAPALKKNNVAGGGYRLNVVCPACYSSDRERLVYLYLKNKTDVFSKNLKLLHIAPERSLQKVFMSHKNIDYISGDLDSPFAMKKIDITNIKYEDNSFDVIICNHVLEHIIDDQLAMSELYRVLKPGGWAILQVPISLTLSKTYENSKAVTMSDRIQEFGQNNHVRIYGQDYKNRLKKAGFSVRTYSFVDEFGKSEIIRYGINKDELVYVCSKFKSSTAKRYAGKK